MSVGDEWPVPTGDRALVLVDASTPVERQVLDRWMRDAPPHSASHDDLESIELPDPGASDGATARPDLDARLGGQDDPWLTPVRVVWLPVERDGERIVRLRDVLLSLDNPRSPRAGRQRRYPRRAARPLPGRGR